ncbi:hypothetical protein DSM107133_01714 [Pseudosulfitobacter sp. DSM 107133]|nr:hypothetical protein DSM107133_01714 [Pseudosulfitobacter sp. DSM 107133]
MTIQLWFAFAMACAVLTFIPGTSVLLAISQPLTKGRSAAPMDIRR